MFSNQEDGEIWVPRIVNLSSCCVPHLKFEAEAILVVLKVWKEKNLNFKIKGCLEKR